MRFFDLAKLKRNRCQTVDQLGQLINFQFIDNDVHPAALEHSSIHLLIHLYTNESMLYVVLQERKK